MNRRRLLEQGLALTPLAAAVLAACGDRQAWPEGMVAIKWDRDVCARCAMVISDRRFAAEVRGGPKNVAFKFDDIGCAVNWGKENHAQHPWLADAATRYWVAEAAGKGERWVDARKAHYASGPRSPMGYDLAAYAQPQPGSIDFDAMSRKVLETWPANCRPGQTPLLPAPAASRAGA